MRIVVGLIFLIITFSCKRPSTASSEYIECKELMFDLSDGTMNGVKPNLPQNQIIEWIPCYTRITPNGSQLDCGGGIIYDKFYFSYYTYIDNCLEVYKGFKGKGDTVFTKTRTELINSLGSPAKTEQALANPDIDFFVTEYGCIRVHYKDELPVLIGTHYTDCAEVNWCVK